MRLPKTILTAACCATLALLVVVPFVQIVLRYVFSAPIVGAEEFTRFLLIVLVFATYPLVAAEHENIVMTEFRDAMPRALRKMLAVLVVVASTATAIFIAAVTWSTIFKNLNNATPTLKIPFWIFLGSTFFGFAATGLVHLLSLRNPPQEETTVL
ncbi:TRAP transporter small permease [Pararhizobium mangrovi]|uniref:TRAP transporter small permease protein n=1 Tax=Pararhizobium mangrovi TaxID=2590452 RepID=A0A506U1U1_9HYPH|nr:TRAP transporter small permease [Pararhizobium mangrovi]TPW27730.1 TRAP transporter small permease [Pararhizobium mangrovi]